MDLLREVGNGRPGRRRRARHVDGAARWRDRLAISWGNAQHDVFHTLRFPRCGLDEGTGNAYAGGFFLRRQSDCVPLRFEVGERRRVLWFGVGRRCPAR